MRTISSEKYDLFGAVDKEAPQLTSARNVLGVGRDAQPSEIKKVYRRFMLEWHPDKHHGKPSEKEAQQKSALHASAYEVLIKKDRRENAEAEFAKALQLPILIGRRVFCLGSLYGVRIYIPYKDGVAITNSSKLIGGGSESSGLSQKIKEKPQVYGVRNSILESSESDMLEMYYNIPESGESWKEMSDGFFNRESGGIDDLTWIKNNDIAANHFMNHNFEDAEILLKSINHKVPGNIIFMYRWGITLEAKVADKKYEDIPSFRKKREQAMDTAIKIYKASLGQIHRRHYVDKSVRNGRNIAKLTVMMQLADAYEFIGEKDEARKKWELVRKIDPNCKEASERIATLHRKIAAKSESGLGFGRRIKGFLSFGKKKDDEDDSIDRGSALIKRRR